MPPTDADKNTCTVTGDGWHIIAKPTEDGAGIEIFCSGNVVGSDVLIVRPRCSNVIHVYSDTSRESRVHDEAQRKHEVWTQCEAITPKRKGKK